MNPLAPMNGIRQTTYLREEISFHAIHICSSIGKLLLLPNEIYALKLQSCAKGETISNQVGYRWFQNDGIVPFS